MTTPTVGRQPRDARPARSQRRNLLKLGVTMTTGTSSWLWQAIPTREEHVFNALTGLRQHTGNWPGKTVTRAEAASSTAAAATNSWTCPGPTPVGREPGRGGRTRLPALRATDVTVVSWTPRESSGISIWFCRFSRSRIVSWCV